MSVAGIGIQRKIGALHPAYVLRVIYVLREYEAAAINAERGEAIGQIGFHRVPFCEKPKQAARRAAKNLSPEIHHLGRHFSLAVERGEYEGIVRQSRLRPRERHRLWPARRIIRLIRFRQPAELLVKVRLGRLRKDDVVADDVGSGLFKSKPEDDCCGDTYA